MAEEKHWQKGMKTHENVIFSCFGGLSNTGITSALAADVAGSKIAQCSPLFSPSWGRKGSTQIAQA